MKAATLSLFTENVPGSISIHAAREGGDAVRMVSQPVRYISIHAAREGGDTMLAAVRLGLAHFNPRRP